MKSTLLHALISMLVFTSVLASPAVMAWTMLLMRERLTLMAEPACAASLGAALGPLRDRLRGKKAGVIACGSNISMARFDAFTADAEMPDAANS